VRADDLAFMSVHDMSVEHRRIGQHGDTIVFGNTVGGLKCVLHERLNDESSLSDEANLRLVPRRAAAQILCTRLSTVSWVLGASVNGVDC
jgi:hypothetical protein